MQIPAGDNSVHVPLGKLRNTPEQIKCRLKFKVFLFFFLLPAHYVALSCSGSGFKLIKRADSGSHGSVRPAHKDAYFIRSAAHYYRYLAALLSL